MWKVPTTGQSASSIARSGRIGVSGEWTCTMSYCPSRSTLRISFRRPSPTVMRACEPFAYTGWLRPEPDDVRLRLGARQIAT